MTSGTTIRGSVVFLDTSDGGRASSVDSRECCLSWSFPISVSCSSISATDQQIGHLLLVIQREYFIRHPPNLVNLRIGHWSIVHFNTLCLLLGLRSCYDRIAIPIGWLPFFVIQHIASYQYTEIFRKLWCQACLSLQHHFSLAPQAPKDRKLYLHRHTEP